MSHCFYCCDLATANGGPLCSPCDEAHLRLQHESGEDRKKGRPGGMDPGVHLNQDGPTLAAQDEAPTRVKIKPEPLK